MQYLLFLLAFIAGGLTTVAIDIAAGKMRNARSRKAYALKARIIQEHESALKGWGTIEARGHGPWSTDANRVHGPWCTTCSHV